MRPDDLQWKPDALVPVEQGRVQLRWLGTAGFEIRHGEHVLLIDPYLSRAPLWRLAVAPLESDPELVRKHVPRADAVIAGHTHFDHVLDVPTIARQTGCRVFGSTSAAQLCRASGVGTQQVVDVEREVASGEVIHEVGPFRLRFMASAHSKFALGRVPFPGEITDCDQVPLRTEAYKCGAVFSIEIQVAGLKLVHLGSAELVEATVGASNVDLLMLCVAGWHASASLPERVMKSLSPRAVVLSHWDDFFQPMADGARLLPAIRFPQLAERLIRADSSLKVGTLPMLGTLWL